MSFTINEGSSFNLSVTAKDSDGNVLSSVLSVEWWVGSPRSKEPILDKQTEDSPAPEMTLNIPSDANICSSKRDEERFVIVKVERSDGKVKHQIFSYVVRALNLVPYPS